MAGRGRITKAKNWGSGHGGDQWIDALVTEIYTKLRTLELHGRQQSVFLCDKLIFV